MWPIDQLNWWQNCDSLQQGKDKTFYSFGQRDKIIQPDLEEIFKCSKKQLDHRANLFFHKQSYKERTIRFNLLKVIRF